MSQYIRLIKCVGVVLILRGEGFFSADRQV